MQLLMRTQCRRRQLQLTQLSSGTSWSSGATASTSYSVAPAASEIPTSSDRQSGPAAAAAAAAPQLGKSSHCAASARLWAVTFLGPDGSMTHDLQGCCAVHTLHDTDPVLCKGCDPSLGLQVPGTLSSTLRTGSPKPRKTRSRTAGQGRVGGYSRKSQQVDTPQQVLGAHMCTET